MYSKKPRKRKLKTSTVRKPKENLSTLELQKQVSDEIGVPKTEVARVINCYFEKMKEGLESKKTIYMSGLGILYPCLNPPRTGVCMGENFDSDERADLPARWALKLQVSKTFKKTMSELDVSEEEIDNMYYKDKE